MMNTKRGGSMLIVALCFALFSFSYAWFRNNQEVVASAQDSIQIRGNGVMLTAYATKEDGTELSESAAEYMSEMPMKLNGKYMDVSGDGLAVYSAALDQTGTPKTGEWTVAEADTAVSSTDSGKYVVADIYFKSDTEMDIYLMKDSEVKPKTATTDMSDLVNNTGYSGYTKFSEFTTGFPALNINQSSFGLFSRNLIAGATRVSFSEYTYSSGWVAPEYPNLVWVPNSTYQLTISTDADKLDTMTLNGTKETQYQFYQSDGNTYTITRTNNETSNDVLTGKLSIKKTTSGDWEDVTDRMISSDLLVPAKIISGTSTPIPQIYVNNNYVDAAYSESKGAFVQAVYAVNNAIDNYVYVSNSYRVQKTDDGYVECIQNSDGNWEQTTTTYTDAATIETIENGFQTDTATYQRTYWIDDDGFTTGTEEISKYKVGTTKEIDASGSYYTRIKIAIWVEGYDRESNIALNSGEFSVSLKFYGLKTQ